MTDKQLRRLGRRELLQLLLTQGRETEELRLLSAEREEQLEELNRWLNADNCQPAEKIAAVTEIYNQLTIRSVCENKMREYYTLAMESLEAVAVAEEKKKELKNLVKLLMYREM